MDTTRRSFCKTALTAVTAAAGMSLPQTKAFAAGSKRKRIAAIVVTYGLRTHADNLVTRLLEGYWINEQFHPSPLEVASVYVLHAPKDNRGDLSERLSKAYGFRLSSNVADALTLGTGELAVDGVMIVSEDGNTAWTKNPFFRFFSQVVDVFHQSGRAVPVFNDKALSHDWVQAEWMVRQSRELGFPLLAGSTLAVTFRRPELEISTEDHLDEALVACGFGDPYVESGGFHGLELLQAMVERRSGGETGIKAVQCLEGDAVWEASNKGLWSRALFDAALKRSDDTLKGNPEDLIKKPIALLIEYNDGLRGSVISSSGSVGGYNFAAKMSGREEIRSTQAFYVGVNGNSFSCLVDLFARMMASGKPANPPERTMLTCGALDFLMRSRSGSHERIETPELAKMSYPPGESPSFYRGMGS